MCARHGSMTEKGKHLGIHALKIRMLVPLHPMPSPAMLRPKNRRLMRMKLNLFLLLILVIKL